MTSTDRLRGLFAQFLETKGYRPALTLDGCLTIDQDSLLKYERIDKYRVIVLTQKDLKNIIKFGEKHGIAIWFGADKLCVGFNCRHNMRLSAYDSVALRDRPGQILEDRKLSVRGLRSAAAFLEDRKEPDPYLDVHGGLD